MNKSREAGGEKNEQLHESPKEWKKEQVEKPPNIRQKEEAPQDLVELVDTRLEEAMQEELSTFMNALKVVHVDQADEQKKGREHYARM